jgi:hypothetical protein
MVHEPREAGRAEAERPGALPAPRVGDGVQVADVAQNARDKLEVTEQLSCTPEAQFVIGGAVGVVEDSPRGVPTGNAAQVSRCFMRRTRGSCAGPGRPG